MDEICVAKGTTIWESLGTAVITQNTSTQKETEAIIHNPFDASAISVNFKTKSKYARQT